eukprot:CAMPEP_0194361158 /NCGR_PEP_ID=MMETSP0174-20130528/8725_1 /TAXON_ID=216777 /ORGANISM="Proboscia alata, Strain PI-D3" /LENGTH=1241 /DNA_ID=CAMNT_0039133213 /DNA_START=112 /DNA_END=3837 /DNA_ORIENTATION=-
MDAPCVRKQRTLEKSKKICSNRHIFAVALVCAALLINDSNESGRTCCSTLGCIIRNHVGIDFPQALSFSPPYLPYDSQSSLFTNQQHHQRLFSSLEQRRRSLRKDAEQKKSSWRGTSLFSEKQSSVRYDLPIDANNNNTERAEIPYYEKKANGVILRESSDKKNTNGASNFKKDSNGYSIADTNNSVASPNLVTTRKKVNGVLADTSLQNIDTNNKSNKLSKKNGTSKKNNMQSSSTSFSYKRRKGRKYRADREFSPFKEIGVLATPPEVKEWKTLMAEEKNNDVTNDRVSAEEVSRKQKEALDELYNNVLNKKLTPNDRDQIENFWDKISPKVLYLGASNVAKIYESLQVAFLSHKGQQRKSGEPFIVHPVEVTMLLADLKMDVECIIAGLLHDTVEDTDLTFDQVEAIFGKVVRNIVEGETKVSKLQTLAFADMADEQAENLRQMFMAMTNDYRIIIVKLADRLHNMRTLRFMKPAKQSKISRETLDIFAPLAHRMGIWQFKSELEDTAFMYLYPHEYKRLNKKLRQHQTQFRETLDLGENILSETLGNDPLLAEHAAKVEVCGRTKEIYSLWHKMEIREEENLAQINDVVSLRIILHPRDSGDGDADQGVWLCYHVLGVVQNLPGFQVKAKVKDYISFPKPNGYQSLHTALMLGGQSIEVQIRTAQMHQVAEYGMASNCYLHGLALNDIYRTPWLDSIKEWQDEDGVSARDFVECVRRELLGKRVFVFLRNGKILNLSRGATVIDAAFQIHTEVGLGMHGSLINGKPVQFSYELRNGDVVNILTGDGKPSIEWMRYAKSRSTRAKLRAYFRTKQQESFREAGLILLTDFLDVHRELLSNNTFLEDSVPVPTTLEGISALLPVAGSSKATNTQYLQNIDDLLIEIGKRHDRNFLRSAVSKILKVPLSVLTEAETRKTFLTSIISNKIYAAARSLRTQGVKDSEGVAIADTNTMGGKTTLQSIFQDHPDVNGNLVNGIIDGSINSGTSGVNGESDKTTGDSNSLFSSGFFPNGETEMAEAIANPEDFCEDCLPMRGDDIIGTTSKLSEFSPRFCLDTPLGFVTVHRRGCRHAEKALGKSLKKLRPTTIMNYLQDEDEGITDTAGNGFVNWEPNTSSGIKDGSSTMLTDNDFQSAISSTIKRDVLPVKLRWSNEDDTSEILYLAEVTIVAKDRKLLLAECSEIVSETAFIAKTGSVTTDDHANLNFLIKVKDVAHLEALIDTLRSVLSVMHVERKFGSSLL